MTRTTTTTTTTIWDPAAHLSTADDVAAYLQAAFQDGDPQLVAATLGDIARTKGISQIARRAGLARVSLNKFLSSSGHPELATVLKVFSALIAAVWPCRHESTNGQMVSGCTSRAAWSRWLASVLVLK
jgi:probable addiction module antidote protein